MLQIVLEVSLAWNCLGIIWHHCDILEDEGSWKLVQRTFLEQFEDLLLAVLALLEAKSGDVSEGVFQLLSFLRVKSLCLRICLVTIFGFVILTFFLMIMLFFVIGQKGNFFGRIIAGQFGAVMVRWSRSQFHYFIQIMQVYTKIIVLVIWLLNSSTFAFLQNIL